MAAEAALSAGEVGVATHLCLQLAAVRHGPAWHLAAELACPHRCGFENGWNSSQLDNIMTLAGLLLLCSNHSASVCM